MGWYLASSVASHAGPASAGGARGCQGRDHIQLTPVGFLNTGLTLALGFAFDHHFCQYADDLGSLLSDPVHKGHIDAECSWRWNGLTWDTDSRSLDRDFPKHGPERAQEFFQFGVGKSEGSEDLPQGPHFILGHNVVGRRDVDQHLPNHFALSFRHTLCQPTQGSFRQSRVCDHRPLESCEPLVVIRTEREILFNEPSGNLQLLKVHTAICAGDQDA